MKFKLNQNTNLSKIDSNFFLYMTLPQKHIKNSKLMNAHPFFLPELDDGQYNPLWTSKGFTQTFHFWKENRRQSSTPLNSFLTYVTLPWYSIAKDLLDHREMPILTF